MTDHRYRVTTTWTGETRTYSTYSRDHELTFPNKPPLPGSSDPHFRGDPTRYNPEELLVASLSACHMLWYLHLCADNGICVTQYRDEATGVMDTQFRSITLRPVVTISAGDPALALSLHGQAHHHCFIARSVNFPVVHEPVVESSTG